MFDAFNVILLTLIGLSAVLPFIYIVSASFSSEHIVAKGTFLLFPTDVTLDAYKYIFSTNTLVRSMMISLYVTIVGTLINLILTSLMAYPLAHHRLRGRRTLLILVLFTMLFTGGLIPTYIVVKSLGLINSLWALMIPNAISAFNLIILKNFFQQIPDGLQESAKIDGANDMRILLRIVLPLSAPALATFALFYAVGHWNSYFNAIIYLNDSDKWPIQVMLRQIVILAQSGFADSSSLEDAILPAETVKMAVITFATAPILMVYPFLQKHFAKGVLLGSVKG
ncbi:carbohydrate ABC transporter permease [Paenibacillus hodogayensis]|jgi:putative aldouronate transport system permease protein|uniref:Carbohydrate ABC transporter permease n=2 Tax=Paenibacillus TaxID=44249 RepID=A0A5C4T7Q9_9BACL|nr:carbohydrate ABC transporter permease [Paenibacillus hemerocallicola]TNJ65133.1 carbohydrate ABC transporter permease [Paenibacillus hemerocallicola]